MILKKTRSLRVNMGHYEHVEVFATMEIDTEKDAEFADASERDVMDHIDRTLAEFIAPDMYEASQLTDVDESFVFPYLELTEKHSTKKKDK